MNILSFLNNTTTNTNIMEFVVIICKENHEYLIDSHNSDIIYMEYNEDDVERVINSSYFMYIKVCDHYANTLYEFLKKYDKKYGNKLNFHCIDQVLRCLNNYNYADNYGCFTILQRKGIPFEFLDYTGMHYNIEQIMNIVKKGTIISGLSNDQREELNKIFVERDICFTLKKIQKIGYQTSIIDTFSFTKSAIKQ